ncbi:MULTISPECIES: DUF6236 family protein [Vibrio harveyi group]|jgi:hypothetical protein|uniref:DUF6236 family protein n=1 Tax=Vibrio harveyi group TaxID=717610 RepID=UPI000471D0CB|nr:MULTISPECIES: DUF6236 family protein [Vibrio harveyi group]MBO0179465.1 hypothetical protein [Vibrio parahaemolyticus]MDF5360014.1 DUF6236 family protein [Vibrio parahaemolyticus]MDG2755018.1 DUF6236 family protein [Vibrio parahaemolyticus]QKS98511.1 hypothetical protein HUO05_25240 [Vibrio alginolyticus]UDY85810.1 DUF6236 family protein [Vibrio diabolicus]
MTDYNNRRGIVLSVPTSVGKNGTIVRDNTIDALEIPKHLLYWDKIELPVHSFEMDVGSLSKFRFPTEPTHTLYPELDYLEECGVLHRHEIDFRHLIGIPHHEQDLVIQNSAYELHNGKEPGAWSISQLSTSPRFQNSSNIVAPEIELYGILPTPTKDVSFEDILEFKERRSEELDALRAYLDELEKDIINSNNIPRATCHQTTRLIQSLKDIDKTLSEARIPRVYSNLKHIIKHDLGNVAGIGASGFSVTVAMDLTRVGTGVGIATALMGLYIGVQSLKMSSCPSSVCYIQSIKKELT